MVAFSGHVGLVGRASQCQIYKHQDGTKIPSGLDVYGHIFLVDRHIFSIVRPTGTGLAASHPEQTPGHADGQQSFSDNLGSLPALDTSNSPGPQ